MPFVTTTLGASLEEGNNILSLARDSIKTDVNISQGAIHKKNRQLRNLERQMKNEFNLISSYERGYNKYLVEAHKKFSIPIACILFVLLGAPLGVMAKKGGFAVSTSLSFGFFLLYYILLIGGEELADRSEVSPAVGMWVPNLVLLIMALYLILYTVRERAPISIFQIFKKESS